MTRFRTLLAVLVVGSLTVLTGSALGGAIHNWTSGEVLTASALNTTLQHIHNSMVGGHGARLVDADVSAVAAISLSKIQITPTLLPKAWAVSNATCSASPCTLDANEGVTSITRSGAGLYVITLDTARADAAFFAQVSAAQTAHFCSGSITSTTSISVTCYNAAGALEDSRLGVVIYDNDPT